MFFTPTPTTARHSFRTCGSRPRARSPVCGSFSETTTAWPRPATRCSPSGAISGTTSPSRPTRRAGRSHPDRRSGGGDRPHAPSPGEVPVPVRSPVLDEPAVEEGSVADRFHLHLIVERLQETVQPGEVVEGNARKVMVLQMEVRPEKGEVPEQRRLHQSGPVRRVVRVDVIVLADAVQGEGHWEDEEVRD